MIEYAIVSVDGAFSGPSVSNLMACTTKNPQDKIREVIGPGGKVIRGIRRASKTLETSVPTKVVFCGF